MKNFNKRTLTADSIRAEVRTAINVFILLLVSLLAFMYIRLTYENSWLTTKQAELSTKYESLIDEFIQHKTEATLALEQQQTANDMLQQANTTAEDEIEKLEAQIAILNSSTVVGVKRRDFKSFMDYRAITNNYSDQWKLQLKAYTNKDGIRCIDGIPLIAIGTGWGHWVGDHVIIICENGNRFEAIVGDIKSDRHTDAANLTTVANGCRCEFIVDTPALNSTARLHGTIVPAISEYAGYVVGVIRAE